MSEHRRHKRALARERGRMVHEVTPMGLLYLVMKALRLGWVFTRLLRKPCHVADLYYKGVFWDARYLIPKEGKQDLRKMKREVREAIQRKSMAELYRPNDKLGQFLSRR